MASRRLHRCVFPDGIYQTRIVEPMVVDAADFLDVADAVAAYSRPYLDGMAAVGAVVDPGPVGEPVSGRVLAGPDEESAVTVCWFVVQVQPG